MSGIESQKAQMSRLKKQFPTMYGDSNIGWNASVKKNIVLLSM